MNLSPKHLIKLLEQNGFILSAEKVHIIFINSQKNITFTVPIHGSKELAKDTFHAILKRAGIENK